MTVTVGAAPAPDLVVDAPTVDTSAPAAGTTLALSATVRNQGNGSSDSATLRYYRSTDSTITTGDTLLGTDPRVSSRRIGERRRVDQPEPRRRRLVPTTTGPAWTRYPESPIRPTIARPG